MDLSTLINTQNTFEFQPSGISSSFKQLLDFYGFLIDNWVVLLVVSILLLLLWISSMVATINLNLRFKAFLEEYRQGQDEKPETDFEKNQLDLRDRTDELEGSLEIVPENATRGTQGAILSANSPRRSFIIFAAIAVPVLILALLVLISSFA